MLKIKNCRKYFLLHVFFILLTSGLWPVPGQAADLETYTHSLTQSDADYRFWTTTPGERVFKDDPVPTETDAQIRVYAAKNEFEPFQLVVRPASSGNVTVSIGDFGSGITAEIYQVEYVNITEATDGLGQTGDYPDPLWPLENGASVAVTAGQNTAFWFSLFVPKTAAKGDYTAHVQIGGIDIPVRLHVFDFAVPDTLHVRSQMNFSHKTILDKYGVSGTGDEYRLYVPKIKQYFIDHRLTLKAPLWSGGLTSTGGKSYISYDCDTGVLSDPHGEWGFEDPADTYLNGNGFNDGTGFPSFMAMTFQNNDASQDQRPSEFCGVSRGTGDWYTADNPGSAYNQKWFAYIGDTETYLNGLGYLDKAYYYFANEPQDQDDYDAVAWYSQELKKAAPDLKLMVSEEPRPEIYDHPTYTGAKIDIWLPVLNNYDPGISQAREKNHGEETWVYFLHGTRPPYFNPVTLDHPGIESKLTGWFLWKYRVRGIAYYALNNWSLNPWTDPNPAYTNHNGDLFMLYPPSKNNDAIAYGSNGHRFVPSVRFELMRDSLEDYEYLYVLAGGRPEVDTPNAADAQADKIISGLTSYNRDSEFMYNLRRVIGLKNGGEIAAIPDLTPAAGHPRTEGSPGNYYINFQDPDGEPSADPLMADGKEYMKIGWTPYDKTLGYGWYGDMAHVEYQYLSDGPDELRKSVIYDDWGREKTFEFDLPNGIYNVTVSVGWQGKTYKRNKIAIEGVDFVNDEATDPYIVRTKPVTISDNKLTMEMGIFDEYTMLNYLDIEAAGTAYTITASAGGGGDISPKGAVRVIEGYDQKFTITPDAGYKIEDVLADGSSVGAVTTHTFSDVNADGHTISVTFKALPTYSINASAGANGTITPNGMVTVAEGADQTFTITPDSGYAVADVLADGTSVGAVTTHTFSNVNADGHTISVTFKALPTYSINASAGANGTITPAGTVTVAEGADQTFTITPDAGYEIEDVLADGSSVGAVTTHTFPNVSENGHTISATFRKVVTYTITPNAGNGGQISPSAPQTVEGGQNLTFTVTPDSGYETDAVEVDGKPAALTDGKYTFSNADADHTITVTFKQISSSQYTIRPSVGPNGSISPATDQILAEGGSVTFTVTPDSGYEVDTVRVDGQSAALTTGHYTFADIRSDHTIAVTFRQISVPPVIPSYTITPTAGQHGRIEPSAPRTVSQGSSITFTVIPDDGYVVDAFRVDGAEKRVSENGEYTFTGVVSDHTLTATFKESIQTCIITPNADKGGTIIPSAPQNIRKGETIRFTVTPESGYEVKAVTVDGESVDLEEGATYTFTAVSSDHAIKASFAEIPSGYYTITPEAGEHGQIDPSVPQIVKEGATLAFTVSPDSGYETDIVLVDNEQVVLTKGRYLFEDIRANHTIRVSFRKIGSVVTHTITPVAGTGGHITPSAPQTVVRGEGITFTVTPDEGYQVDTVLVDGKPASLANRQHVFINVMADHTLRVTFRKVTDSDGDGVPDDADNDPDDATSATPPGVTGTGSFLVDTSSAPGTQLRGVRAISDTDPALNQSGKPDGYEFRDGLVTFRITGETDANEFSVAITFPSELPDGAICYTVDETGFHQKTDAVVSGKTVTLTGVLREGDTLSLTVGMAIPDGDSGETPSQDSGGGGSCFIGESAGGTGPFSCDSAYGRFFLLGMMLIFGVSAGILRLGRKSA